MHLFRWVTAAVITTLTITAVQGQVWAFEKAGEREPVAADPTIKRVFVVPESVERNEANAVLARTGQLESFEVRFNTGAADIRCVDPYFQVIHHRPGKPDEYFGQTKFGVTTSNGQTVDVKGMAYCEYQRTMAQLRIDVNKMWGDYVFLRDGVALATSVGMAVGVYKFAKFFAEKKKVFGLSWASDKILLFNTRSKMGRFAALMVVFAEIEYFGKTTDKVGRIEDWILLKAKNAALRDELHNIITQSYKFATFDKQLDESLFSGRPVLEGMEAAQIGDLVLELPALPPRTDEATAKMVPDFWPVGDSIKFTRDAFGKFFTDYYRKCSLKRAMAD